MGRKRRKKHRRKLFRRAGLALLILFGALVLLGGSVAAGYFWMRARGQASFEEKQAVLPAEMDAAAVSGNEGETTMLEDGMIRYQGKVYSYKRDCLIFLCMGIDKRGEMEASEDLLKGGQADAIFLAVLDPDEKKISIIGINRDTMTEISVYDENGLYVGTRTAQIALQHGYGDGMETSCERMVDAVSHLFYGIPIHGYCSLNMEVITLVNDAIGGVTVTVPEDREGDTEMGGGRAGASHGRGCLHLCPVSGYKAGTERGGTARQAEAVSAGIYYAGQIRHAGGYDASAQPL